MTFLAQLPDPNSAQAIGFMALALVCLIGGINQVLKLTDRFKENPPTHDKYATKTEHYSLAKKMDDEFGRERGARKLIHQEIAALQSGVAAIEAKTDGQTEQLGDLKTQNDRLSERIDLVPERTIKLLGETQRLHQSR